MTTSTTSAFENLTISNIKSLRDTIASVVAKECNKCESGVTFANRYIYSHSVEGFTADRTKSSWATDLANIILFDSLYFTGEGVGTSSELENTLMALGVIEAYGDIREYAVKQIEKKDLKGYLKAISNNGLTIMSESGNSLPTTCKGSGERQLANKFLIENVF